MAGVLRPRAVLAIAAGVLTAVVSLAPGGVRPGRAPQWDRRLAPIAREVERLRHLRFDHPIPTRFLSDRAFRRTVTSDDASAARARPHDRVAEAELRALGLVGAPFDLRATVDDVNGSDVLAYYDSDRQHIVVRGT